MSITASATTYAEVTNVHALIKSGEAYTLTGNVTLDGTYANIARIDPGGAARVVTLDAEENFTGLWRLIRNTGDGGGETLTLQDDAAGAVAVLPPGQIALVACDGSSWTAVQIVRATPPSSSVATLAADLTLNESSATFQKLDPGGSARDVNLPAEAGCEFIQFRIANVADAAENLVVKDDGGSTIATLAQNRAAWFVCDGTDWNHMGIETIA